MHSATDTSRSLPASVSLVSSSVSVRVDESTVPATPTAVDLYIAARRAEQPALIADELGDYAREVDVWRGYASGPRDTAQGRANTDDVGWTLPAVTR